VGTCHLAGERNRKRCWINLPVRANDTYIRNVALMLKYGSDGINPYASPQANPVYHLQREYSSSMSSTVMNSGILLGPFHSFMIAVRQQATN